MANPIIVFENCEVRYAHLSGLKDDYHEAGKRDITIVVTPEMAEQLKGIVCYNKRGDKFVGANIKTRVGKNEGDEPEYLLKINIGEEFPPRTIWKVTDKCKIPLSMKALSDITAKEIEKVNCEVSFSPYEKGPNRGITAYCNNIAVWMKENGFMRALDDIPTYGGPAESAFPTEEDESQLPF